VGQDIFRSLLSENENFHTINNIVVTVIFFEIYGGKIQDLLNDFQSLKILGDGKGEMVVQGLEEYDANNPSHLLELIDLGN